jgi:hypothetical protein
MRLAMAKPMPRAPPVTIAVRFFRSMAFMAANSREVVLGYVLTSPWRGEVTSGASGRG